MNSAEKTALFVIEKLALQFGIQWLGGPRSSSALPSEQSGSVLELLLERNVQMSVKAQERIARCGSLGQLIEHYYLRSVRDDSQRALTEWMKGLYPIRLIHHIPTPEEMLAIQCEGLRYVTWLEKPEDQDRKIGRHDGSLSFLLHDLEHADKFFSQPASYSGQKHFFNCIRSSLARGFFQNLSEDQIFFKDFHYVMSDMNSHPVHLFKYLKAIVLMTYLRRAGLGGHENLPPPVQAELDDFWRDLLHDWGMNDLEIQAGVRMNRPHLEQPEDGRIIGEYYVQ